MAAEKDNTLGFLAFDTTTLKALLDEGFKGLRRPLKLQFSYFV